MEQNPLWKHQQVAIERAGKSFYFGLFFEPGTGKTRTTIEILRRVYTEHGKVLNTLIITPLVTVKNWQEEWGKYSRIKQDFVVPLLGTGAQKLATFKKSNYTPRIYVINYDALVNTDLRDTLTSFGFDCLVIDESHYIKTYNSKRSKAVHKIADKAMYRYILSGTPVLNSPEDIWSQMYVLDRGERFETKHHFFKLKYFYDKNAGMPSHKHFPNWQVKPGAMKEMEEKISSCTMHVKKSECLDLPPLVSKTITCEMSSKQKQHYELMKRDFVTYVQDKACVASLAITKALRLQQILTGYMPLDDGSDVVFEDNPRLDVLGELLELYAQNSKVIVWSCFKKNHEMIAKLCDKMKLKHVGLTGEQSSAEKFESMRLFNEDDNVRVMIANQSVGIGVNLVASNLSIYFSRNFNLGHDIQSEARNYRGGSEIHESVTRIDIVVPDTLDDAILKALQNKKEIGAALIKEVASQI